MHAQRTEELSISVPAAEEAHATAMRRWLEAALWPVSFAQAIWVEPANQNDVPAPGVRPAYRSASGFAVADVFMRG